MPLEDRREFSTLVARLPVAIFRTAPDGRILMANQAFADLLGYETVAELQRLHAADLYADPADRDDVVRRLLDGTKPSSTELLLRRKDGTAVWARARAHTIDDGDGPRYFEGVLIEISEQKQAEVRLGVSEDRFRTVFLASPVGMVIRGPDLEVRAANPAICGLLEMTEEQLIEAELDELLVPEDVGPFSATMAALLAGDLDHYEGEHRLVTARGEVKTMLTHITVFRPAHGELGLLGQFVDISERRRMQEKLEQLVRSKDELVRTVSHELRTPLTSVVGFASELEERPDLTDAERGELIGYIAQQSREMAELVEDLLAAARAGVGPVNVRPERMDLVEACRDMLETWSDRTIRFVGGDSVEAWADPFRVRQIMRNLLTNAARYGSPPVQLYVALDGSGPTVRVSDGGPALPRDEWEAIFEPYRRAHGAGERVAVGLGLAVSRRLARRMDGELSYRSDNGRSVFELRLPAFAASAGGEPEG